MTESPIPLHIRLLNKGTLLTLDYGEKGRFELSAEFLRVHSPSAEVQGHGGQGGKLPIGKQDVTIKAIERSGRYALQFIFDDGHDSGIYTWNYLWQLIREKDERWRNYLIELRKLGATRSPEVQVLRIFDPSAH